MRVRADEVLNLTEWAKQTVEHPDAASAWAAFEADAQMLTGRDVYVDTIESGRLEEAFGEGRVRARVTSVETRRGWVNVNDEWDAFYIDPYVDVALEGHDVADSSGWTYGRSHKWPKKEAE